MAYDIEDQRRATRSILERVRNGTLRLHDQIGVVDARGSYDVVKKNYLLYHLSADASIVTVEWTKSGVDLMKFDDETGESKDGRGLRLVEPVFQLALRDRYALNAV